MNPVIYVPKGAAREYAPLAANLYRGCSHGCRYCYAPAVLRRSREAFATGVTPRPGVLHQLKLDAKRLAARGEKGPILLSFTSDPYQPAELEHGVTVAAIRILSDWGLGVRILTKNPACAVGLDMHLLVAANVEFGVSLSWTRERDRVRWEPHAGTIHDRVRALATVASAGLRTWVSIEPVINPAQALDVLDLDTVDVFKIGKRNHDKAREARIDWRKFLANVLAKLEGRDCGYYIKHDLGAFADDEIKGKWARERAAIGTASDIRGTVER